MIQEDPLRGWVEEAIGGSREALHSLVDAVRHDVYNVAIRMLAHPHDAEDATQEILVKIVTRLDSFRGESAFRTWVYHVAVHHLLNARSARRRRDQTFEAVGAQLEQARQASAAFVPADDAALVDEVKLHCTHGMLLCLDPVSRLAFILGEILDLPGDEAAALLELEPAAYRQRLSRARRTMDAFLKEQCGLANPAAACRCARLAPVAVAAGTLDPARLFATHPVRRADALRTEIDRLVGSVELFRRHPDYAAPDRLLDVVATIRSAPSTER